MSRDGRRVARLAVLIGSIALVAGCREDEQGRMLLHEKGTYQGPADQPLSDEQIDQLRLRAREQRI